MSFASLSIEYSIGGGPHDPELLQRMQVAFSRAGEEISKFGSYVYPKLVPVFEEEERAQFAAEGEGPNTGGWQPLSEAYAAWKAGHYPGQPILVATGNLREALTSSSSPNALRTYDAENFDFGTAGLDYASFHQTGTGKMPARPEYDFTEHLEAELQKAALEGVREAIKAAGANEFLTESH